MIALDVFRKIPYPKIRDEQTAWLALLATEDLAQARQLAAEYPWLAEIYREMEGYLHRPEEVLNMFSEALRIMDRNTVQYMIDEQLEQISEQQNQIGQQQSYIDQQETLIARQQAEIARLKRLLDNKTQR